MVATLLKIEGTPAIDLRLQGSGPLDQVDVNFSLDADQRPHRPGRGRAALERRGARLHRRLRRRPLAAGPGAVPRLLRRLEHGQGRGRAAGRRRPAHRHPRHRRRGAEADRRARDRARQLPAQPHAHGHARRPARAGGGAAGPRRAHAHPLGRAARQLRRRQPLGRPARPRPAGGGRHRDGGRDLPPRRPGAEPRGPGDPQASPSTSRAWPPGSGRPSRRSPARSAPGSTSSPTPTLNPGGPVDAPPAAGQRQRPLDLQRRRRSRT